MVSIRADNLTLAYPVPHKFSLRAPDKRTATGGTIATRNGTQCVVALDGVSFELAAGDRLGLIGTNGAGKTTLLKTLYGIHEPTSGSLVVHGRVDALFNINLGFRKEATGRRNIVLRGLINGWTPARIEERIESIIAFSELGDFIDLPLKTYSQGMAARLAFAIATEMEPEILLMDEWIGAGDPAFQEKAKVRMSEFAEKAGIVVLASHKHDLLRSFCNKLMELEHGRIKSFQQLK